MKKSNLAFAVREAVQQRVRESMGLLSSTDAKSALEGPKMRVVLITEGLGNRANMNYYGPEAIDSAPAIFEGKPAFHDHPSESDERDIPERRIRDKCGYFKNCMVETINGVRACTGEIHFDLSESGRQGYLKALTALHYKEEFPSLDSEYVGLSINASGDYEERTLQWQGENVEVKYVVRFTDATSCDIVTQPARGGRFLALVESAAGASTKKEKEDVQMNGLKKSLEAARSAMKEAVKEEDAAKAKKKMAEADKLFDAFFKEAMKQAAEGEVEEAEVEGAEAEEAEEAAKEAKKGKEAKKKEADDADEDEDDDAEDPKAMKAKKEKKESNRIVVVALAKEAKITLDDHAIEKLSKLTAKEAQAEIASLKAFKESIVKDVVRSMEVPVGHYEKATESERSEMGSKNNELFADCSR